MSWAMIGSTAASLVASLVASAASSGKGSPPPQLMPPSSPTVMPMLPPSAPQRGATSTLPVPPATHLGQVGPMGGGQPDMEAILKLLLSQQMGGR